MHILNDKMMQNIRLLAQMKTLDELNEENSRKVEYSGIHHQVDGKIELAREILASLGLSA